MSRLKRGPLIGVIAVLILAGLAWYAARRDRAGRAPEGQPPVATVDLARFRAAFNAAASEPRLLVLLSPT